MKKISHHINGRHESKLICLCFKILAMIQGQKADGKEKCLIMLEVEKETCQR